MKKQILLAAALIAMLAAGAQNQPVCNPYPKTISVTGSAETELIPDEIYVNIHLREYQKKGEAKVTLEKIKADFITACNSAGVMDSAISIQSYTGYSTYYWNRKRRKKDPDLFADIVYQVKFPSTLKMDLVIDRLDDDATQNFYVVNVSHSRITEYRRKLKVEAIKAAKEKGQYLAEAINEKLGTAITVAEPKENIYSDTKASNMAMNSKERGMVSMENMKDRFADMLTPGEIDFRKIKLRFEVEVLFALQ